MAELNHLEASIDDIIGREPSWIVRSGNSLLLACIILVLTISAFLSYPDIITSPIQVTDENPPLAIKNDRAGYVANLLVSNAQHVEKDQALVVFANTGSYQQISQLAEILNTLPTDTTKQLPVIGELANLGTLQSGTNRLKTLISELHTIHDEQLKQQKWKSSQYQIQQLQSQIAFNTQKRKLLVNDLKLANERFKRKSQLAQNSLVSVVELLGEEQNIAKSEIQLLEMDAIISDKQKQISILQEEWKTYDIEFDLKKRSAQLEYQNTIAELKTQLTQWKQQYVLTAKQSGVVVFNHPITEGRYVEAGTELLFIQQEHRRYVGYMYVSASGAGKVKIAQKVKISLNEFPQNEFGFIQGNVLSIASIASEKNEYLVTIDLPKQLEMSYKQPLATKAKLLGVAEIVTQKYSWLERVFLKFRAGVDSVSD